MIEKGSFNSATFVNEKVLKFNKFLLPFLQWIFFFCTTIKCKKSSFLMWGCGLKKNSGNKWNKYLRNETGNGKFFYSLNWKFFPFILFLLKKIYNCVWNEYVIRWTDADSPFDKAYKWQINLTIIVEELYIKEENGFKIWDVLEWRFWNLYYWLISWLVAWDDFCGF